mmetsp:Transcript_19696/g.24290  ORF Transcript_19696/g.24290 Transcript_19696/m.24290 type:complete len:1097 (+) Transcript_19696:77-3367(+)
MIQSLFPSSPNDIASINAICIGSGRFLRSVLVPALIGCQLKPIILQTRGRSFMDYCHERLLQNGDNQNKDFILTYEVDTVFQSKVETEEIKCYGAGTLGTNEGKEAFLSNLLPNMKSLSIIAVGVTEAGLSSVTSKAMQDLADILYACYKLQANGSLKCEENSNGKICVICTDNVPNSGSLIQTYMFDIAGNKFDKTSQTDASDTSTDNVSNNGPNKKRRVDQDSDNGASNFRIFLEQNVVFHDTMVDRITSQREGSNGMVPRAEPVPSKALVIEDLNGDLPKQLTMQSIREKYGVVARTKPGQLTGDIALKLRVANGTHTAIAHVLALSQLLMTDVLSSGQDKTELLMKYLDSLFTHQILPGAQESFGLEETKAVYEDWRQRLTHPKFGLSSFFITQNGAQKCGIRISPTVSDLILQNKPVTVTTIFAIAAILRFLTPINAKKSVNGIYTGWLDGFKRECSEKIVSDKDTVSYADGLSYNLRQGWYEFRCSCEIMTDNKGPKLLPDLLGSFESVEQPIRYEEIIRSYLTKNDGGNLSDDSDFKDSLNVLVKAVSTIYARMVAGDGFFKLLHEMNDRQSVFDEGGFESPFNVLIDTTPGGGTSRPLHYRRSPLPNDSLVLKAKFDADPATIKSIVFSEVSSVSAIDLHTHLLPPSHGALCLWGIDELLTYHYLVAEYFMTASPNISPEEFFAQTKQNQADAIWKALFIDRSPVSEACRGVITTLTALDLQDELQARDLNGIRLFYNSFRDDGIAGAERYSDMVFKKAGIRYAVMTNIPFDPMEVQHWRPKPKDYSNNFRAALRVDPLLSGDRKTVESALLASGYNNTIDGAKKYLHDWCDLMKPEYLMASTPHDFVLKEDNGILTNINKTGVNEDAMKLPGAFVDVASSVNGCNVDCDGGEDGMASVIDENSDFLSQVLMKVCEERDLPLALKIGAHRQVNPRLQTAGDGVVAFADTGVLARLCTRFPNVRFLATFLSRNNQHEACVLATKFRNLHLYGCWWFCNNPSIIEEITKMRVEMLGTAFTAQHSDSRVLDQLIYKWSHSRGVIGDVLSKEIIKLIESGWSPNRDELRRDVKKLFGGSYEDFMSKSFVRQK